MNRTFVISDSLSACVSNIRFSLLGSTRNIVLIFNARFCSFIRATLVREGAEEQRRERERERDRSRGLYRPFTLDS